MESIALSVNEYRSNLKNDMEEVFELWKNRQGSIPRACIWLPLVECVMNIVNPLQGREKRLENLVKQDPGKARQNSSGRARRNFSQPRNNHYSLPCTEYRAGQKSGP